MRKRSICAIFAVLTSISLVACVGKGNQSDSSLDDSSSSGGDATKTVYEEISDYPDYDEVDMTGYTVYYFDSVNGNDENDGLSEESPKQTLAAANRIIAKTREGTPVRVAFKAGSAYDGVLRVGAFTATEEKPLIVDSYGATDKTPYPVFSGAPSAVEVTAGNVRICGLEITNKNAIRGIYVYTVTKDALKNVVLKNNYLHDINFDFEAGLPKSLQGKGTLPEDIEDITAAATKLNVSAVCPTNNYTYANSAIYFDAATQKATGASWFENVWVDGNRFDRVSRDALFVTSNWIKRPGIDWGVNDYITDDNGWYPHKNFNVVNNYATYTGGDGMVLLGVDGGYMQNNTLYHAQYLGRGGFYNAGLWVHSCKNFVMQYNEAAYTHKQNGAGDGQGFDIDIGNCNITFRFNYSHHNQGGGILLCTNGSKVPVYNEDGTPVYDDEFGLPVLEYRTIWENVTVANNVFADNDDAVFTHSDSLKNLSIVNNTIIMKGESGREKIAEANGFFNNILNENVEISNNIFYLRNKREISFEVVYTPELKVENNLFYNFNDSVFDSVNAFNNCFIDPGFKNVSAENGFENALKFRVTDAKILAAGKFLAVMNAEDYAGESVNKKNYIGAFATVK